MLDLRVKLFYQCCIKLSQIQLMGISKNQKRFVKKVQTEQNSKIVVKWVFHVSTGRHSCIVRMHLKKFLGCYKMHSLSAQKEELVAINCSICTLVIFVQISYQIVNLHVLYIDACYRFSGRAGHTLTKDGRMWLSIRLILWPHLQLL